MRLIFLFTCGLTFYFSSVGFSQADKIESILKDYSKNHLYRLPQQDILKLVELSRTEIDNLFDFAKRNEKSKSRVIVALGFLCTPEDEKVINFIEEAYLNLKYQKVASNAIFRIGGSPLNKLLTTVFSKDNFNLQIQTLEKTWVLDRIPDLQLIKIHVDMVLQKYPNWKISGFISNTYYTRLNLAIKILSNSNEENQRELKNILEGKNMNFISVPGAVGRIWATKMLVTITHEKDKKELIQYLIQRIEPNPSGQLRETFLFHLYKLGYQLPEKEISWIKKNYRAPTSLGFRVFRSADELNQYHLFRKVYPFERKH